MMTRQTGRETPWIPGLIPSQRTGWWTATATADSEEILSAIADDEARARKADAEGDGAMSELHWKRWAGLHFAYVSALAREIRASVFGAAS